MKSPDDFSKSLLLHVTLWQCFHYDKEELAAFSCLLMHASLCALTTLPMVFKLHQNMIFPLWPIIPHKEQGEFQFTSIQKHLLLFILSLGMLLYPTNPLSSCPVRPTLSSLEPTELQCHMLNLFLPSLG